MDLAWKRSALDLRLKNERKDVTLQLAAFVSPTPLPPPLKRLPAPAKRDSGNIPAGGRFQSR